MIGRTENQRIACRAGGRQWSEAPDKDGAERIKKLKERLPRERRLSDYVLRVPKSKLDDTLKPRAELLEKKPEPSR